MNASSKSLTKVALAILFLITASAASAYVHVLNSRTNIPIKWDPGYVEFRVNLGDSKTLIDGSTYNSSFQAAADIWTSKLGCVVLRTAVATGTPTEGNKANDVLFAANIFGREFGTNILAVATRWSLGNRRTEADIVFNTAYTWDSYRGNVRFPNGVRLDDTRRVALHEIGHALGLNHPDEAGQTVSAVMNSQISNTDTLTSDDISGGQALYGPPGIAANDSFANAIELFLTTSNTFSVTGYNTNCTKESGEPLHADNKGGRSIWYKWAAAIDGGATLDTIKSNCDTTLAVYTGTTLASLVPVASSDDIDPGVVQASKLTFYARKSTTYYFAVDGFDGDASGITLSMVLDPNATPPPTITTQPASIAVTAGARASFSVAATGTGTLTYQWQFNGAAIAGATAATYEIASAAVSHAGSYTVQVSNSAGTVTSDKAVLTVNSAPVITTQPASLTVNAGDRASFSVAATGSGTLTYQWLINGSPLIGATSDTFVHGSVVATHAGNYTVVVSNSLGSVTSNAATLTVNTPPTISTQPANVSVNVGDRASFSVTATGTGTLTYQWLFNGTAIAGATAASYEIASAATTQAGNYSVKVTNTVGSTTSNAASLAVAIPPPTISTQPGNLSLSSGGRGTLSVAASGTGTLTYQWRLNGTAIAGATSSSYEIANATQSDAGTYTVVVTASGSSTTSNAATVTVSSPTPTPAPSSSGGGGGGGGAPSLWFCGVLALLAIRRVVNRIDPHRRP